MSSTCQPYLGRETTELGLERLRTILVHRGRCSMKQALGLILLHERHRTGDGVANVDRSDIVKVHLRSQKADQAANMGHHATGEQTRDNSTPEPTALSERLIYMVWVIIPCYLAEEGDIPF